MNPATRTKTRAPAARYDIRPDAPKLQKTLERLKKAALRLTAMQLAALAEVSTWPNGAPLITGRLSIQTAASLVAAGLLDRFEVPTTDRAGGDRFKLSAAGLTVCLWVATGQLRTAGSAA